ncbi:MAG: hypothetical protein WAR77_04210 [Saprospiraceae bacterium]
MKQENKVKSIDQLFRPYPDYKSGPDSDGFLMQTLNTKHRYFPTYLPGQM